MGGTRGRLSGVRAAVCAVAALSAPFCADAAEDDAAQLNGVVVGTYQHTDRTDTRDEWSGSADLLGQLPVGPGLIGAELKAGTRPRKKGVSAVFGEANASVGETLDRHGDARAAMVQLYYSARVGPGRMSVGLLDSTGILDSNAIASVEYTQFLGTSFVHNPAVEFPSFALGANYLWDVTRHWRVNLFVSSTSGLEDRSDPNYRHVLSPLSESAGIFGAMEAQAEYGPVQGNAGLWVNGANRGRLSGGERDEPNFGVYTNLVGPLLRRAIPDQEPKWSIRLGVARSSVSPARDFQAFAVAIPIKESTLGLGVARTGPAAKLPRAKSLFQLEAYWKLRVWQQTGRQGLYLSPDIQYMRHSNFDPGIHHAWVLGVRLGYEFCFAKAPCL